MGSKINIAIDGHSSCGKGTLAKNIAKELGYTFIDSGAMYRCVALFGMRNQLTPELMEINPACLNEIKIDFIFNEELAFFETHLNGENVEGEIRNIPVSKVVSAYSAIKEVREFLVAKQKEMGENKGVVMDGRDIGTVVFPDAELKIFMTALPEIRAQRRHKELLSKGQQVSYQEVLQNIEDRDRFDTSREHSPLIKADDAIVLDNSHMTREEQAHLALSWARGVIAAF